MKPLLFLLSLLLTAAAVALPPFSMLPSGVNNINETNIQGLFLDLNPDGQSEADGTALNLVRDFSGRGNHLIHENAARRFTLKTGVINGRSTFRLNTTPGMFRDNFTIPAEVTIFFCASNEFAKTIFNHGQHWFLNFVDRRQYDWPNLGQKLIGPGFNVYSFVSTNTAQGGHIFWENGVPLVGGPAAKTLNTSRLMVGANQAYSFGSASTDFGRILMYSNALTTTQRQRVEQSLCSTYGRTWGQSVDGKTRIYCVGDSITIGIGLNTSADGGVDSWPTRLQAKLNTNNFEVLNLGISANTLLQISNRMPAQVHPFYGSGGSNVLIVWEYVNAIAATSCPGPGGTQGTMSVQDAFNAISNICKAARSAGWTKIMVPTDFHTNCNVQTVSDMVRTQYVNFADYTAELNLQSLKDDATLQGDGIHLTTNGWAIVSGVISNAVRTIYP